MTSDLRAHKATIEGRGSANSAETQAPEPSKVDRCPPPAEAQANTPWRTWSGPFTSELRLAPGRFGLGHVPARLRPELTTRSICGFCATGCSLDIHLQEGLAVNLSPSTDYPVNRGMACPKGWESLTPLAAPDRATSPMLRDVDGLLQAVSWETALRQFVQQFKSIQQQHGPESVAFLSTGQICTEEMALLGALFKFGMGGWHGDSNTRQCMATAHVAYKQSFGFDAPPYTYADFELSDVLIFVGSNLCIAHPILWQRVLRNPHRPEIIVIDPRQTETALNAGQHLALRPKSDLILFYGLARLLIERGWIDRDYIAQHTTGFEKFAEFLQAFPLCDVAGATDLTVAQLERLAATIHQGKRVSFWWTMGVNQGHEATRTAQAIINLALLTGHIGRPGTGANSITGQCNAMGSRLFGNTTSLLGGRDFLSQSDRAEVADILQLPVEQIPARNSLAYDQILEAIDSGQIKGLWIIATNSAHSWVDQQRCRQLLDKLDFLVVQDLFANTDTAQLADLFLPAAGWGEKEGTFINSERRYGVVKNVARAPGLALSDFRIFRLVADYWGCGDLFREWTSPAAAFQILKRLSAGRPCDITGIKDYQQLEEAGGIQWPCPETTSRLNQAHAEPGESGGGGGVRSELVADDADRGFRVQAHSAFHARRSSSMSGPVPSPLSAASPSSAGVPGPLPLEQERRLFADGRFYTTDGKAKFLFEQPRTAPEIPDAEYPFILLTGRGTSAQWHTNTRTGKSAVLRQLYPANAYCELNPADAKRLDIRPQDPVVIRSRRGRMVCTAFVTATVQPGQIFIPMHYPGTNQLTQAIFDPHSRQPAYKQCAVRIEPEQRPRKT